MQLAQFYWVPRRPWLQIGLAVFCGLFVVALEAIAWVKGRAGWTNFLALSIWFFIGPLVFADRPLYAIAHGVLTTVRTMGTPARIPLADAEIQRERYWRLRWSEGRRRVHAIVPAYPPLLALIEQGLTNAPDAPRTRREAERLISAAALVKSSPLVPAVSIYFVAAMALAIWLNHPLFLFPLVALPFFSPSPTVDGYLLLTPDALYVARPDTAPVQIPFGDVTEVVSRGRNQGLIYTRHPDCPQLTVNRYQATDLLRRLEHLAPTKQM